MLDRMQCLLFHKSTSYEVHKLTNWYKKVHDDPLYKWNNKQNDKEKKDYSFARL